MTMVQPRARVCLILRSSVRPKSFDAAEIADSSKGVSDDQPTDTGDGVTQSHQLLPIQLIGSTEIVDDFGHGFSGFGMTLIVRQLVVLNTGTVFVFTFCGPQVHAYIYIVYLLLLQA